ncbi:MAG: Gfo/Idh/MocA family protein [Anaerolineae bacterium]
MADKEVRVGVVGTGMGRLHMQAYSELPGVRLVAVCDLNEPEARFFAEKYGAKHVFSDYREMFTLEGLDAVSIAVPNYLHAPMTLAALEAGLHVLCEKPMATEVNDAVAMMEKARAAGKRLMVHMNMRFRESTLALGRLAPAGELGQVYYGRASMLRRRAVPTIHFPSTGIMGRGPWFLEREKAGGGALMDIGVHTYDLMWWCMGCPKPISVSASTYRMLYEEEAAQAGVKFDVDEFASAFIRFEGGATAFVDVSWAANQAPEWQVRVCGTKAGLQVSPPTIFRDRDGVLESATVELAEVKRVTPQAHFVDCIRHPEKPLIASGEEGVQVVKVLDAIRRSATSGREVTIE